MGPCLAMVLVECRGDSLVFRPLRPQTDPVGDGEETPPSSHLWCGGWHVAYGWGRTGGRWCGGTSLCRRWGGIVHDFNRISSDSWAGRSLLGNRDSCCPLQIFFFVFRDPDPAISWQDRFLTLVEEGLNDLAGGTKPPENVHRLGMCCPVTIRELVFSEFPLLLAVVLGSGDDPRHIFLRDDPRCDLGNTPAQTESGLHLHRTGFVWCCCTHTVPPCELTYCSLRREHFNGDSIIILKMLQ